MIAKITPRHRRPFWCGGIEFPAEGRELDLSTLSPAARAAIAGEHWLLITTVDGAPVVVDPAAAPPDPAAEAEAEADRGPAEAMEQISAVAALAKLAEAGPDAQVPLSPAPRRRARS